MFTGIIEAVALVEEVSIAGTNKTFWISSPISHELRVDQSVSHSGVCLTVEEVKDGKHRLTAIEETLKKTSLNDWKKGTRINLERCLTMNSRLDGHIVQGHVDTTALCVQKEDQAGSWEYVFEFDEKFAALVIEKGSISVNGTSLTLFSVSNTRFSVAIIPYTYQYTNINQVEVGTKVNIEFDIIGKYVSRFQQVATTSIRGESRP